MTRQGRIQQTAIPELTEELARKRVSEMREEELFHYLRLTTASLNAAVDRLESLITREEDGARTNDD